MVKESVQVILFLVSLRSSPTSLHTPSSSLFLHNHIKVSFFFIFALFALGASSHSCDARLGANVKGPRTNRRKEKGMGVGDERKCWCSLGSRVLAVLLYVTSHSFLVLLFFLLFIPFFLSRSRYAGPGERPRKGEGKGPRTKS